MDTLCALLFAASALFCASCASTENAKKRVVLVSGESIHYWGDHENEIAAGIMKDAISETMPDVIVEHVKLDKGGAMESLGGADAVIIFGEGEKYHPFYEKTGVLEKLNGQGTGFGIIHYALQFETPEENAVADRLVGGHYDISCSVNPTFLAEFKELAEHPAARGVKPFSYTDEWYFNIKFADIPGQKVTPIACAIPPDKVRKGRFGPHTGNQEVRDNMGKSETIAWVCENPNGTRGFGFTGAHGVFSYNNDDMRKLLLNLIAWTAKIDIPDGGFNSSTPAMDYIEAKIAKEKRPDYEYYIKRWKDLGDSWHGEGAQK